jgi:hypothetical protein
MDQGVRTRIIERYRWLLERVSEELDREKITNLLVEEHQRAWVIRSDSPT